MSEDKPLVSYTVDPNSSPNELLVDVTMSRMINGYQGGRLSMRVKDPKSVPDDAAVRACVINKLKRETGLPYVAGDLKDLTPGAKVVLTKEEPKTADHQKDDSKKSHR